MDKFEEYLDKAKDLAEDAKAVKELKLATAELEKLPEDGSIIYKMDREAIINDMNKLTLFVTDRRLDDASVAEEIKKVMDKVRPTGALTEPMPEEMAKQFSEGSFEQPAEGAAEVKTSDTETQGLTDEEILIEKAKMIAYSACTRALEAIAASA